MANSTWLSLTNNVLRQSGLPEIPDDSVTFDNPNTGLMTRFQSGAREFVRVMHEKVSVDLPVGFARRRFQLNIDNVTGAVYPLDTGMSVESLTFDSFRNLTQGGGASAGRLRNWTYEYFSVKYADLSLIYSGSPTHFIILPIKRVNASPIYEVRVFPNPDTQYQLEYIAQLNAYPLRLSTDVVMWPPEYEHVITDLARFNLEDLLGEGKAGSLGMQAEAAYQKARQKATSSRAERKSVRMKKLYSGRSGFGYYNSPADDEAPYSTPDGIR